MTDAPEPKPDHMHIYLERGFEPIIPDHLVRLICFNADCYLGADPKIYPPELIGPKIVVKE